MSREWNPALYESSHSFVWEYGRDLIALLAPQAGERILDVGCGTGQLTAEIARSEAEVVGVDSSSSMIEKAVANFPGIRFEVRDVCDLQFREEFDAVFSNAALHWVLRGEDAVRTMAAALRTGGRLVVEFGGHGNTRALLDAVRRALLSKSGSAPEPLNPWFFPKIGEYAGMLEQHGLEVSSALLFDRPTPLDGGEKGLANWLSMFGGPITPELRDPEFVTLVEQFAAPQLRRDGGWFVDYRRLRIVARKQ